MNYGIDSNILIKFVLFKDLYMKKVFSNLWTVLVCGAAALILFAMFFLLIRMFLLFETVYKPEIRT